MLFTTLSFVFLFLPVTWAGFYLAGRWSDDAAAAWLFAASLVFYAHWMPVDLWLLLGSITGNFLVGARIIATPGGGRGWLMAGVAFNLSLLGCFKYANFVVANLNLLLGTELPNPGLLLPIGISFYSFTQIAFLVDTYQRKVREPKALHYGLFVTYFPHLVAGPVLHHAQMMPQFRDPSVYRINPAHCAAGLAIFALGLFKKVVLADGISPCADAVFKPADAGLSPDPLEGWLGALAYTFQLYFDFSAYSDMAIGLSWLFNVRLPFNFDSPYRATNISDFWRRWHISLSSFLRDYLYIALGGNRHGSLRRYLNLAATMVLGGLWHGASWTFVVWGALHGLYLMVNHGFRALLGSAAQARLAGSRLAVLLGWALTMLGVVVAWVVFRAETFGGALRVLQAMAGASPSAQTHALLWNAGLQPAVCALWCAGLGLIAVLAPNSNRIGQQALALALRRPAVRAPLAGAALCAVTLLVLLNSARDSVSAFIYFNF